MSKMRAIVNGNKVAVPIGATVAEAARLAGVHVPTLCYSPRFKARGVCRMCLVEVEGKSNPVAACSTVTRDGDRITTDSDELRDFRRFDLELMLARHPNACMTCNVDGDCKLQALVQEDDVIEEDRWPKLQRGLSRPGALSAKPHLLKDHTSPSIERDMTKCIDCGLCVSACSSQKMDIIGFVERSSKLVPTTVFDRPLNQTDCISCGQCTLVCPTGALTERADWKRVLRVLDAGRRTTVVQTAPASRISMGELFGLEAGTVSTGRMISSLRALGFDYVFDTNFAADLTIMEEAHELLARLRGERPEGSNKLPLFTSCCPGWVNYLELKRPDLLAHLSTSKSPQQMHAAVTKNIFAPRQLPDDAEPPFVVSIMPCTAKKDEAVRPDMFGDVDAVLTTRELARLIRHRNIPFASLSNDAVYDSPLGESTGAGMIFGASGGVMEAALRTAVHALKLPSSIEFTELRGVSEGSIKVATVAGLGKFAAVNSMGAAVELLKTDEWKEFVMIEVMACLGGCLGGGGEPKSDDPDILAKRAAAVYGEDERSVKRSSHENQEVHRLYEFLGGKPLSHMAERLLHTTYAPRRSPRELLGRFLAAVDRCDGAHAAELFNEDGVWDTGAEEFGKVCGGAAIAELVDKRLPAKRAKQAAKLKRRPLPGMMSALPRRHRLVNPTEGFVVEKPDGSEAIFDVVLDPDSGKIANLTCFQSTLRPKYPAPLLLSSL